jgi:hypothetical protein
MCGSFETALEGRVRASSPHLTTRHWQMPKLHKYMVHPIPNEARPHVCMGQLAGAESVRTGREMNASGNNGKSSPSLISATMTVRARYCCLYVLPNLGLVLCSWSGHRTRGSGARRDVLNTLNTIETYEDAACATGASCKARSLI